MILKCKKNLIQHSVFRILLVFVLLIIVKSSTTFSEERGVVNGSNNKSVSELNRVSVDVSGKTFSFIVINPTSYKELISEKNPVSKLKHDFSLDIISKGNLSPEMLSAFLTMNNPALNPNYAFRIATIYIEEAHDENINSDVAFSQMCLETAYLKFGGDVLPEQNNFCGLGVVGGGVRGSSFSDVRAGIRAHIQHLKAYASKNNLVNPVIDRRFKFVKRGSATDVHKLTGKWATDKNYGKKINSLLVKMYAM